MVRRMTGGPARPHDGPMNAHEPSLKLNYSVLSPREEDVLAVAAEGVSAKEIARRLFLTEATVRSHLSSAYAKLGVSGRVELLARMNASDEGHRPPRDSTDPGPRANAPTRPQLFTHRRMALLSYTVAYGAVWGYSTYQYMVSRNDPLADAGLLLLWTAMAFAGSILVVVKDLLISDKRLRTRFINLDVVVPCAALAMIWLLAGPLGFLRGFALVALFGGYVWWYLRALMAAGLK